VEAEPEFLGTYSNIYRLELRGSKYLPVLPKTTLRLRGEIGVVDNVGGDDVAIFERYFAGGGSSFRGFDRREVSPVDVNEDALGGESLLLGTAELIYAWNETVRTSIFTDLGNVWRDAYEWDPSDINVSIGVGLQLDLPIGPIRFDYGIPIVRREDHLDSGGRLHFNLGYYF
jgi:outer membrane protein insertion porin family